MYRTPPTLPPAIALAVAWLAFALAGPSAAQQPLYRQTPFDLLVLKSAVEEGSEFKIMPLELPSRRLPSQPSGSLKVRLVDDAANERLIQWRLIARVDLFENMVLREASQVVASGNLDGAFPYFVFLKRNYPGTEGLASAFHQYLFAVGGRMYTSGREFEALAALEELYDQAPEFQIGGRTVLAAISVVSDKCIAYYVNNDDLDNARRLLKRLNDKFTGDRVPGIAKWRDELSRRAAVKRDELAQMLRDKQYEGAHRVSREMLRIWPDVPQGRELADEAARRFPVVAVGVAEPPAEPDVLRLDSWAARRQGRLHERILMEFLNPGPEGGVYLCPWGVVERDAEDPTKFMVELRRPRDPDEQTPTGYALARLLLTRADPDHSRDPLWASLLKNVRVEDVYATRIELTRPSVLPEALLRIKLQENVDSFTPYRLASENEQERSRRYLLRDDYMLRGPTQPAQLTERFYEDSQDAIEALRRGEIDIIDRLYPADAASLKATQDPEIEVHEYATPTLHMLWPNYANPFLANRHFRRALVYAIARDTILEQIVLEGKQLPGCRVISAPLPAGKSATDTMSYAYNEDIAPRAHDARQAYFLRQLALKEMQVMAEAAKEKPPELKPFVLGHPPTKLARSVCAAIKATLEKIELEVELKEFPPNVTTDESCDLVFAEVAMNEPLFDAERLLGADGLAKVDDSFIALALRRLNRADTWRRVSNRLRELHETLFQQVAVIPLWQIQEHYAHRKGIYGIGDQPSNLYQEIERWRVTSGGEE